MKAIGFRSTGALSKIEILELPEPGPIKKNQVRLKFLAGSLNHLDLWVVKGLPHLRHVFPQIAGSDICGEVIESRSKKFKVGNRVLVYPAENKIKKGRLPENLRDDFLIRGENFPGVFAEQICVDEDYVVRAPKHLSPEEAAALPLVYLTAWQMLFEKAGLTAKNICEHQILVHGAGSGVSQAILELLKSMKAKRVATTSRNPQKLVSWESSGFSVFESNDDLEQNLKSWSGSEKFSVIFDHIGEDFFEMNIRLLRSGGAFVTCGATSGFAAKLDLRHLFFRQLKLHGSTMGSLEHFRKAIRWIDQKRIRPKISKTFSFARAQEAYAYLNSGQQDGKAVIVF